MRSLTVVIAGLRWKIRFAFRLLLSKGEWVAIHEHDWYLADYDVDSDGLPMSPQIACRGCDEVLQF